MFNDYIDVRVYQTPPGDGDRSNWKRLLSGAVALSHCIFHSVTTCSTPSRCVPLRHDLAIQTYALTNIHSNVIPNVLASAM